MTPQAKPLEYHPWSIFAAAKQEARRIGDRRVGTDVMLLGLLRDHDVEALLHVSLADARAELVALDNTALSAVGLPEIVRVATHDDPPIPARPSVRSIMETRIRLTPAAKTALREAAKPMRRGNKITGRQVLLALLENKVPDPAATLLSALKVDRVDVRARLEAENTELE